MYTYTHVYTHIHVCKHAYTPYIYGIYVGACLLVYMYI